ncbi:BTB/POZ domain-containing protein [Wolffia australiana]
MDSEEGRVKLNVGGMVFETTASTLRAGGPDSLLGVLSAGVRREQPIFIDRDPEIFSVLLSILRAGSLPAAARRFSMRELAEEALYYGIEPLLRSAAAPRPLLGFDASPVAEIRPAADAVASAMAAGAEDGSLWIAHGGQISSYDWTLSHVGTVRTHIDQITALRRAWPDVAAVGSSLDSPGLHLYDTARGRHLGAVHWTDASDPRVYKATVSAIAADPGPQGNTIYAAFECPHRENCILAVDRATLRTTAEIGRLSGSSTRVAAPMRLVALPSRGLLFATAVSAGAFGFSGYMRLWDSRAGGQPVWEAAEPGSGRSSARFGDSFADADVDPEEPAPAIYKVCWKSGDVGVADLRMLGDDPWVYLEDRAAGLRRAAGEGQGGVLRFYKKQIFVSSNRGLQVWSPLDDRDEEDRLTDGQGERSRDAGPSSSSYRSNFVDGEAEADRGCITMMEGGGDRLFVCREGAEGVQVWESSDSPGIVPLT